MEGAATQTATTHIVTCALEGVSDRCQGDHLATFESLSRKVQRQRKKLSAPPPAPSTAKETVFPPQFQLDSNGNRFLLFDSNTRSGKRVVVFATEKNLTQLNNSSIIFLHGTFATAPQGWVQVFIIRIFLAETKDHIPVAFCLLENKAKESYRMALQCFKDAAPSWNPEGFLSDFETAITGAVEKLFPTSWMQGCNFHLDQMLLKHMKRVPGFGTNKDLQGELYVIFGLAFLPADEVAEAWSDLSHNFLSTFPESKEFCDYVESTWIDGRYTCKQWNCYDRTLAGQPRTNNVSEGGNNVLRLAMGCVKPVIWKWIETILKVQLKSDFKINQFMCGGSNVSKKKSEIKRQESMSRLVRDYSFVDPDQRLGFVRKMSHFSSSQKRRS